ncbi:MAG: hypothetical protein KDB62_01915 [Solirubrobacterales bacterium]|nr:hypothetical protein [Solirubrobacterales bacterium]
MEVKTVFMIFGIVLAVTAVVVSFAGLRYKDFPSRGALIGMIVFSVVLVAGTTTFAVKLSVQEQEEREHGESHIPGEETSVGPQESAVAPLAVPARF